MVKRCVISSQYVRASSHQNARFQTTLDLNAMYSAVALKLQLDTSHSTEFQETAYIAWHERFVSGLVPSNDGRSGQNQSRFNSLSGIADLNGETTSTSR